MAMNKYMHPRNIYKTPPNFSKLAKTFEEFSSISKLDVTGKVNIDFKDPNSLRILTKCLLKADFNLDVSIPEDRLVPTLPLRLNYILWLEDLLHCIGRYENIKGIDIGTGACAIYPLLAAVNNKWNMVATETDEESMKKALENVQKNNLQAFIEVKMNQSSSIFQCLFADENAETFDFSMCNPPFYSNVQELCESRSPARLPPKNGFTGSPQELITEGGELGFCRKMISESKKHQDKVLIFTTMVGHKFNLKELTQELKADGIHHTTTEFCQGRVTRWGLAWTFRDYDIGQLLPGRDRPRKKSPPTTYLLPEIQGVLYNVDTVSEKIKAMLLNMQITYKILNKRGNNLSMDVVAMTNTWSNQRRKRRLAKRCESSNSKKPKLELVDDNQNKNTIGKSPHSDSVESTIDIKAETLTPEAKMQDHNETQIDNNNLVITAIVSNDTKDCVDTSLEIDKLDVSERDTSSSSTSLAGNSSIESAPLVHAFLKLFKKENDILLEMEFLDGSAGKEGVHQIVQFIKNNWK